MSERSGYISSVVADEDADYVDPGCSDCGGLGAIKDYDERCFGPCGCIDRVREMRTEWLLNLGEALYEVCSLVAQGVAA